MLEEIRYVPHSARRYSADYHGNVYQDGVKLEPVVKDNCLMVKLDWVAGRKLYSCALIVLICFGKIRLPDHLYEKVEPLYIDGNWRNLRPVNLIYRYKDGPLEVERHPGFYHIPLYNDYGISAQGELINIATGKLKSWSVTKSGGPKNQTGGYLFNRVVNDEGFSKLLFLHRALCMVFLPYGGDVLSRVVNHKDGNPDNNRLENLEWTSYRENNLHAVAIGLRPNSSAPILMRNLKTGETLRFESIAACAKSLGHERDTFIAKRLQHKPPKVYEDMLVFKFDDGQPWPDIDVSKVQVCRVGSGSDIIARNVFTGEKIIFTGSNEGERLLGIKAATILTHVRDRKLIPVNGYNFRYLEDANEWPGHTDRHLQVYAEFPIYPPEAAVMIDLETGQETFYTSVAKAAQDNRLTSSLLYDMMASGRKFKSRYVFKLFKLRDNLGHPVR